jgi:uncharacterized Fe-S cluster-containing radical SAM superfamily protein
MKDYPRFVQANFAPFDPVELAGETQRIAGEGDKRKYTDFYCAGVYGGIATGYLVGCNLRCVFCWVQLSREYPERYGRLYGPDEAAAALLEHALTRRIRKVRISGGEPTLAREHLLKLIDLISKSGMLFILETNGILLGRDPTLAAELSRYENLYVRISIKAGTEKGFQERTGALGKFFELPFRAVENASSHGLNFRVACMSDPGLMSREERIEVIDRLADAGYTKELEEETCDPYDTTLVRLKQAGREMTR